MFGKLGRAATALLAALICLVSLGLQGAAPAGAAPAVEAEGADPATDGASISSAEPLLEDPRRGTKAIRELGDQLPVAAARNDMKPAELRSVLRSDATAWIDPQGSMFYIDPAWGATEGAGASAALPVAQAPLADTFALHSNPGANLTILLDFDGAPVSGTAWNSTYGVTSADQPAWDPAGDGPGFSDSEKLAIQQVWSMVAEDYAPFNVDVTTEDTGPAAIERASSADSAYGTRVLVTPGDDPFAKICNRNCGGVAYISVFDSVGSYLQPAWVFPQGLGNDAKNVAEAAAHEAGHNLGLQHDGTSTVGYYSGHGLWAPIMGVGYDRPLAQWSAGSYIGANNQQDDVATLRGYLGTRADEASGSFNTPATLPHGAALIGTRDDVDSYLLGTCAPGSVVDVLPAPTAPDLDVRAVLLDGNGTQRASAAPVSQLVNRASASGLGASITVPDGGDSWVLTVEGVGQGTWAGGGYDDYGSLGTYTISAPGCDGAEVAGVPGAPNAVTASVDGQDSLTMTWSTPDLEGDGPVTGYVVTRSGVATGETLPATARSHTFTGLAAGTTYQLAVRAVNGTGAGKAVVVNATTTAPTPAAPSAPRSVTGSYNPQTGKLQAWWSEPESAGTSPITGYAIYLDGSYLGQLAATSRGVDLTSNAGYYEGAHVIGIAAVNAVGSSPTSNVTVTAPPAAAPSAPRSVTGSYNAQTGKLQAWWSEPETAGTAPITGYDIYLDGGYLGKLAATSRGVDITSNAGYYEGAHVIGIAAVNAVGSSPRSNVTVTAPPRPANDDVANAEVLTGDDGTVAGDNTYATRQSTDPTPPGGSGAGGRSVWYSWTPAVDGQVSMATSGGGSNRDTTLAAYTGTPGALTQVAGNDDANQRHAAISFVAKAGTRYLVAVDGFPTLAGGTGPFTLGWNLRPPAAPSAPTGVQARSGDTSATVTWTAPEANGAAITGYTVTARAGDETRSTDVDGNTTSAVLTGLTNGRTYAVTVTATNAVGTSPASDAVDVVPDVPDTQAPTMDGIASNRRILDPFFHPGSVTVRMHLTDDRGIAGTPVIQIGPNSGSSWYVTPNFVSSQSAPASLTKGDRRDGIWKATFFVPKSVPTGQWSAWTSVTDAAGNITGTGRGVNPTFVVANDPLEPGLAPAAPQDVTATPGDGRAEVSWTAPAAPATDYTVWVSPGTKSVTVDGTRTSTVVEGLENDKAYTFTVVAGNRFGESPESAPSSVLTPSLFPVPPTGVTAASGDRSATVSWRPGKYFAGDVTAYRVTAHGPGDDVDAVTTDGAATSLKIDGLTNGDSYTFDVVALNDDASSEPSAASDPVVPAGVPTRPTAVTATRGDRSATVTWTPADANGAAVTGYTVTSSPDGITRTVDGDATTATVNGLANGTAYTFTVVATNAVGHSAASEPSNEVTPAGVPDAPARPTVVRGNTSATVTWAQTSGNGDPLTGYTVTRSPGGITQTVSPDVTSATFTGLTNGTVYTFTVVATNAVGDSLASSPSAPVVPATEPRTITRFPVKVTGTKALIKWSVPSDGGSAITAYRVTVNGKARSVMAPAHKLVLKKLKPGRYKVQIAARNAVGYGRDSVTVKFRVK